MQIIGFILIGIVIGILFWYFKWSRLEATATKSEEGQVVTVVVEGAYNPNIIRTKKGEKLTIVFDRKEDTACSKEVIFPDFGISEKLADFGKTEVALMPKKVGEYKFSCSMGMYQGKLVVEE